MKLFSFLFIAFVLIIYSNSCFAEDVKISTYYPSPYGVYKHLELNEANSSASLTQILTNDGMHIATTYSPSTYTPGLFWSTTNPTTLLPMTKPMAGIWAFQDAGGFKMTLSTANNYTNGIVNNGANGVTIDKDARVGIGTIVPLFKLDVVGSGGSVQTIASRATDGSLTRLSLQNNTRHWSVSNYGTLAPVNNFVIADETAAVQRLVINTTGNVGIGTSTPTTRLDVNGNVNVNGAILNRVYFGSLAANTNYAAVETTLLNLVVTSHGGRMVITGKLSNTSPASAINSTNTLRLYRGAVLLDTWIMTKTATVAVNESAVVMAVDVPAVGNHTYSLRALSSQGTRVALNTGTKLSVTEI